MLLTKENIQEKLLEALNTSEVTPEYIIKGLKEIVDKGNLSEKGKTLRTIAEIVGLIGRNNIVATQINVGQASSEADNEILRKYIDRQSSPVEGQTSCDSPDQLEVD